MKQRRDTYEIQHPAPRTHFESKSSSEDDAHPLRPYSPGLLWADGTATAFVAGLLAVAGILFARGALDIAVLAPTGDAVGGTAGTVGYAVVAAAAALAATGLLQLMLATTPDAVHFFTRIVQLLAVIAAVLPLGFDAGTGTRVVTALLNTLIGAMIAASLRDVARRSRK
ncbi:DUF6069 family protein [Actinosynnema sp. NPDC047251]|uniref:DUF6069 family protein n=1 Tax=Saccharothrix espanaensis TaxID=103731 RepID=UPI0002F3DD37|nr:DUF6069 family protein [Saccharothrix espanaensis]